MNKKRELDYLNKAQQDELDRQNPNLLIDDAWRKPHQDAMKEYYKNNLLDQLGDRERLKNERKRREKESDDDYRRRLAQLAEEERRMRDEMNA